MLTVKRASDPSLINWQNLGITKCQRRCRVFISSIIAIMLLLGTTFALVYAKYQQSQLSSDAVQCGVVMEDLDTDILTTTQAEEDNAKPKAEQNGYMFCFCEQTFFDALTLGTSPTEALDIVFSDGE